MISGGTSRPGSPRSGSAGMSRAFEGEVAGQPGRWLPGPGQAEGADAGQHLADVPADARCGGSG